MVSEPFKEETAAPATTETTDPKPTNTSDTVSESIYDYEFDVSAIQRELVSIGLKMGLKEDSFFTPDSSSWANPVTVSENFQGNSLERALKDSVCSMPELITDYGREPITSFDIYVEAIDGDRYKFYYLYGENRRKERGRRIKNLPYPFFFVGKYNFLYNLSKQTVYGQVCPKR